jgi:hypothetical protein
MCVRNVCLASCGGDAETFDEALGEGVVPIANICRPASAYAVRSSGGTITVFDLTGTTAGTLTTLTLSRWTLDEETSMPAPTVVNTATLSATADTTVFAGQFVALNASASEAVVGLTTTSEGYPGQVFRLPIDGGANTTIEAPSNFDAVFFDATHIIVNGAGLRLENSGQGLYVEDTSSGTASQLASGLGDFSGSVDVGASFLLAGGVTGTAFENHVYAIPSARVTSAIADGSTIAMSTEGREVVDPSGAPLSATFSVIGDRLVPTPFGGPLTSYRMSFDGSSVTLSDPHVLAAGTAFIDAHAAGEGRLLLVHSGGLLLVEE